LLKNSFNIITTAAYSIRNQYFKSGPHNFQFCRIFLTHLTQLILQGQPCLRLLLTMLQLLTLFCHKLPPSSPLKASPISLRKLVIVLLHLSHQSLLTSH
jgi:hypothetical protein